MHVRNNCFVLLLFLLVVVPSFSLEKLRSHPLLSAIYGRFFFLGVGALESQNLSYIGNIGYLCVHIV